MSEPTGGGGTGGTIVGGWTGTGGGFGIQTHTNGVFTPSPRSWYHPVGYSMTVGIGSAPSVMTGGWPYTEGGLTAKTGPDPMMAGYDGPMAAVPNGTTPCRENTAPGGQNRHGSTGRGKTLGSGRAT